MRVRVSAAALLAGVLSLTGPAAAELPPPTTYTYDANGNVTSKTEAGVVWTYRYDSRDLLREVQRDGTLLESYQYDAQGRRIRRTSAEGIVRYVWDENRIIQETDDFGNTIATYTYAGDRLLSRHHVTEGTVFFLPDALGSPTALMTADGAVAARYQYDAWGNIRSESGSSSNPIGFTGHRRDDGTGLYQANARYYDPAVGRFTTEDPATGDPLVPPSLHPYLYAHANPTMYRDPTGRYAESGHYYTVYYAALRAGYPNAQAQQLAFYSQLPDESTRLDGMTRQVRSGVSPQNRAARTTSHRSLHALTGWRSDQATAETLESIRAAPDLESAGMLLHRLGDSFSHRQIGAEGIMYPTGIGHGLDGTDPDKVLQRPGLYREYVGTLVDVLGERRGLTPAEREQIAATSNPLELRGTTFATLVRSGEDPDALTTNEGTTRAVVVEYLQAAGQVQVIDGQLAGNARTVIANCLQSNSCQEAAFEHRIKGLVRQEGGSLAYQPEEHDIQYLNPAFNRSVAEAVDAYNESASPGATTTPAAAERAIRQVVRDTPPPPRPQAQTVREDPRGPGAVLVDENEPPQP